ncbi:MAG: DUF3613 domain-containing protein [Moraxellaceae bacterium]
MKRILMLTLCMLAMPALAADKTAAEKSQANESAGPATVLTWLDMQRAGSQASSVAQTLTPVIQERVVKRYLDSFNAPIPVFFADESSMIPSAAASR